MFYQYVSNERESDFYFNIAPELFVCRVYEFNGLMYMDVSVDDERLVAGKRVVQNEWILPEYLGRRLGNFRFETSEADRDSYPNYEGFNEKFKLAVYSPVEFSDAVGNG